MSFSLTKSRPVKLVFKIFERQGKVQDFDDFLAAAALLSPKAAVDAAARTNGPAASTPSLTAAFLNAPAWENRGEFRVDLKQNGIFGCHVETNSLSRYRRR